MGRLEEKNIVDGFWQVCRGMEGTRGVTLGSPTLNLVDRYLQL